MNKTITIQNHSDPGHSWYAVKRSLLLELGIEHKITSYSYQSKAGTTVYLEEDCDATTFFKAAEAAGYVITVKDGYKERSPVRSYPDFVSLAVLPDVDVEIDQHLDQELREEKVRRG